MMPATGASTDKVPRHERHFYATHRAFGRMGMRIFEPQVMDLPHWHGHVEINLLNGADMTYLFDNEVLTIRGGQAVIFWAGIPHQLTTIAAHGTSPARLANLYMPLDAFLSMPHIASLQGALLGGAMVQLPRHSIDAARMDAWYGDYRSGEVERAEILRMEMNAILRRTMLTGTDYLRPPVAATRTGSALSSSHIRHVVRMVRHILENLSQPIRNADVTAVTGLHENYAIQLFSKTMRVPIKRFIIRMRLIRARAALIESTAPITSVAAEAGFNSISQFYSHFSRSYGISPNELRRAYTEARLR